MRAFHGTFLVKEGHKRWLSGGVEPQEHLSSLLGMAMHD